MVGHQYLCSKFSIKIILLIALLECIDPIRLLHIDVVIVLLEYIELFSLFDNTKKYVFGRDYHATFSLNIIVVANQMCFA